MTINLRKKIYLGFSFLVGVFLIYGVITIVTLNEHAEQSGYISDVVQPAIQESIDLKALIIQSRIYTVNCVLFHPSMQEDKAALIKLRQVDYPELKKSLNLLSSQIKENEIKDRLNTVFSEFDELLAVEMKIITITSSNIPNEDSLIKNEAEMILQRDMLPRLNTLIKSTDNVLFLERNIRSNEQDLFNQSSINLRIILKTMILSIIFFGFCLSLYFTIMITDPINKIREIVNEIGKGNLKKIVYKERNDEIGKMVASVNNLATNLRASAIFATEIGEGKFNTEFKPVSNNDTLGKALITMRDNLKLRDELLSEAEHMAKLGSWEFDLRQYKFIWSDELYNVLGLDPAKKNVGYEKFKELICDEDRTKWMELMKNCFENGTPFSMECKILTATNILKNVSIRCKIINEEDKTKTKIIGIVHDITDLKIKEEILQAGNAELKKSNMELDKFVYSVSHDLRAPLSSMLGIVKLSEDDTEDPLMKENLSLVKGSILKLDGFIQDILVYSRNSRLEIKKSEINFKKLLSEITGNLKYMENTNDKIKIITDVEQSAPFLSDQGRLSVILNNLISNSIRYHNPSEENSFVDIKIRNDQSKVNITVTDNGIGIKKELHQKIFEMFYRVSENSNGSGLGLYIVKETIAKLQGEISVESDPGKGTKFNLIIPNS